MLSFGYTCGLPKEVQTAWGCRAIIDPNGWVDVPPDRIDLVGPQALRLADHLNHHVRAAWRDRANELLKAGALDVRVEREVILYQDRTVVVRANTHASGDYLYVCAYLIDETTKAGPDGNHTMLTCGCVVQRLREIGHHAGCQFEGTSWDGYPWIRRYGQAMGSYRYYIEDQIALAQAAEAPLDAYREELEPGGVRTGIWKTVDQIASRSMRRNMGLPPLLDVEQD